MKIQQLGEPAYLSQEALRRLHSLPNEATNIIEWMPLREQAWLRWEIAGQVHEKKIQNRYV